MKNIRNILLFTLLLGVGLYANPALHFSHMLHIQDAELECETCHNNVSESQSGQDDLFNFDHDVCGDCHSDAIDEDCEMCHTDLDENPTFERIITLMPEFSHKSHLVSITSCDKCHDGIGDKEESGKSTISEFSTCISCHVDMEAHPKSHTLHWETLHGRESEVEFEESCGICHTENSCFQCHEGDNIGFKMHPINYTMLHKNDFMTQKMECETCHEHDQCLECHTINMVKPLNHMSSNWATFPNGGNHGIQAINRIENCQVCHESEEDHVCLVCHK